MVDRITARPAHAIPSLTHARPKEVTLRFPIAPNSLSKLRLVASELAQQPPPIDDVKINRLRAAIAAGEFIIDPAIIARAMLRMHAEAEFSR